MQGDKNAPFKRGDIVAVLGCDMSNIVVERCEARKQGDGYLVYGFHGEIADCDVLEMVLTKQETK